ncbi:hypothetical protein [Alteromonas sp. RKMC-009]|uniref:hypothetical protein n=1 Tax=Alteromonas sp. RKMC-009 TaxID=2267264 RepID=UPI000E67BDE9|nr:hypothetical protein [Alteromonas sp. RKMC-009]AYA64178.1 hypothetical protein DS731_09340 [Alteromonas sp. RKMC-009]
MNVWEDLLLSLYRPEYIDDLVTPRVTGGFVTCPDFGVDEYFKIEIKPGFTSDDPRSENYCPPPGFVVYQEDLIIPRESVHTFEKSFTADTKNENPEISEKIEGKYLRIIKGLMDLLKEKRIAPYTQDLIVDKLLEKYADADSFPGDTSIKQVFAKANKLEP